jgi:allantoin racemase
MRIVIINPNTTQAMTETIAACARKAASSSTEIVAVQPLSGPVSIEGVYDGALAVPGVIEEILRAEASGSADAYIIACFDDTGLDAARSLAAAPVIGIGEAAFHVASLVSSRFAVITTLSRSVPIIERNLTVTGLAARCAGVRASDIPVLALEDPTSNARPRIAELIDTAIREQRADGIVLGCAGMSNMAADLSAAHNLPVIEGVSAATRLAETLIGLGLTTSKFGLWAPPLPKSYGSMLTSAKNVWGY